jgi:peptidoglycan/LPS O-acetylase OafA/YrhL
VNHEQAARSRSEPRTLRSMLARGLVSGLSGLASGFSGGARELVSAPAGTIPGLDVLRTLAILLVISGHVAGAYAERHGHFALEKLPLFYFGWTGVDLFFILSGYLIGRQLWKELHRTGTIDVPTFLLRRGLRIWPLYFFFVAFLAFVVHGSTIGVRGLGRALPDLVFVSNYRNGILSGGWSLSTEEQFYIVTPLVLLVTRRVPFARKWALLAALFAVLPAVRLATYLAWVRGGGAVPPPRELLYTPFHTHADGLVLGLFFAWLSVAHPARVAPRAPLDNWRAPLVLIVLGTALRQLEKNTFAFTGLALLYGGMALFMLRDRGHVARLSSWRGFHLGSRLSYGMYLNHFLVLPRVLDRLDAPVGGFAPVRFFVCYAAVTALSLGVAAITFCAVEHPLLRLRERWLEARERAEKQAA